MARDLALVLSALVWSQGLWSCAPSWHRPVPTKTHRRSYYMELSGTPPEVRIWGGLNDLARFRVGPWSVNRTQGLLSGPVALLTKTKRPLAVTLDLSSGDDPRFAPQFESFSSAWTRAGRAQWYDQKPLGKPRVRTWRVVLPGGHIPSTVRLSGRLVVPESPPDLLLEPEDILAASPPVRWVKGWLAFPYRPGKSGWGSIRSSGKAPPIERRFLVPRPGWYQVFSLGVGRPHLRIAGKNLSCRPTRKRSRCGRIQLKSGQAELQIVPSRRTRIDAVWLTRSAGNGSPTAHIIDPRRGSRMLAATLRHALDRARCHCARKVSTAQEWKQVASSIRRRLADSMDLPRRGPKPSAPRTLLRGTVPGPGFDVQKLWIEGVDGIWASALLYRPNRPGPLPAVLHILGHYKNGKLRGAARILDANLAAAGIAVLAVDNLSFGDRRLGGRHGLEDNHFMGFWHVLAGSSAARVIYGETFRFLDYLWTRPWVDRRRLGVTGSSGGGTASLYLAALDERVSAASVVAAVSTWDDFGRFRGGDPEQYPRDLVRIADFPALLALVAPRHLLVAGGARDDLFPASQGRRAVQRAKKIYAMLGAVDALAFHADKGPHGYKKPRRDATLAFFTKLWTGDEIAHCRPRLALAARKLHVLHPPAMPTLLQQARSRLSAIQRAWSHTTIEEKRAKIAELVGVGRTPLPSTTPTLHIDKRKSLLAGLGRSLLLRLDRDRTLAGILMEGTKNQAPARPYHRPTDHGRADRQPLDRGSKGKKAGVASDRPLLVVAIADGGWRRFVTGHVFTELGMDFLAMDLSGWGELTPDLHTAYGLRHTWKRVEQFQGIESFFAAAYLLVSGDSLLALRTRELLSVVEAAERRFPGRRIGLAAQGPVSSVLAILASILDARIEAVLILDGMGSLKRDMARAVRPLPDITAPGLLSIGDMAQLAALSRARILFWAGAKDNGRRPTSPPRPAEISLPGPNNCRQGADCGPQVVRIFPNEVFWPEVIANWSRQWEKTTDGPNSR